MSEVPEADEFESLLGDYDETDEEQADEQESEETRTLAAPTDPLADDFEIGDPVIDLANGRNMVIVSKAADSVREWSDANNYELTENYGNERLRALESDPVFTCVYVASCGSMPTKTYDFPSSRLGRPLYENPDESGRVYDLVAIDVLEELFNAAEGNDWLVDEHDGGTAGLLKFLLSQTALEEELVETAYELALAETIEATD